MSYDPNQPYGQPQQPSQSPPPYGQPPYQQANQPGQPPTYYSPDQAMYGQPPQPPYATQPTYGVFPTPEYAVPPQPKKGSVRWLWITLGIIGGLILLSCAACGVTAALGIGFFAKTVGGPIVTVTDYYQAIEHQNYAKAYMYLDPASIQIQGRTLTQQEFTTAASALDLAQGKLSSYNITNTSVNNTTATVTVTIVRGGESGNTATYSQAGRE